MGKYVGWLETTPTFKCQMFIPPTMRFYKSTLRNYMYVVLFTHEYRTQQQYKIEIFNFNYSNVILTYETKWQNILRKTVPWKKYGFDFLSQQSLVS